MPKTRDYMREAFGYIKNPTGLLVMNSIMNGGVGLVYNVSEFAVGWRRSNNIYCGCKEGSFRIYPKTSGFTMQDCVQGFYEWLGNVFQEIVSGSRTWAGMIYSMDLSYKGDMRRRSFEDMYNAIKGQYTEMVLEGSPPVEKEYFRETAWYLDQDSIDQFGRKEYIFQMDGFPQAAVEQKAQALIRSWGRPYPRLVDLGSVDEDYLDVKVLGFAATGNWRYVTAQDGLTGNANVWISNIMATDCQFLTAGSIVENTIQIKRTNNIIRRGIDTMDFVAELGGANYMPWQIYVDHR